MTSNKEIVRSILAQVRTEAAKRISASSSRENMQAELIRFTKDEIDALENAILGAAPRSAQSDELLATLHSMIRALEPDNEQLRQVAVYEYPKYRNILADRSLDAVGIYEYAKEWLATRSSAPSPSAGIAIASEIVVASIIEFQVLNTNTILPLLESVRDSRIFPMHQYLVGVQVVIGGVAGGNSQKRLLIIAGPIAKWFKERLEQPQVKDSLGQWLVAANGPISETCNMINGDIASTCQPGREFTLTKLIEAACQMAISQMPTSVLATRSGLVASHHLEFDVLGRIAHKIRPAKSDHPMRNKRLINGRKGGDNKEDIEDTSEEEGVDEGVEDCKPEWMARLRAAVKKKSIDDRALAELAESGDPCGRSAANFAKMLRRNDCESSTIYRYVFLVANRLLIRLGDRDPEKLELDEWEELVQQILEEDAYFHRKVYSEHSSGEQTGYSGPLLKALRRFGRHMNAGGKGVNPVTKLIPADGGIHVNAQMVTVDEYLKALAWFQSWRASGISDYMKKAARAALILGFRCGLRQAEVAYLRVSDFDAIGQGEILAGANLHLHVRPWFLRQLKTSNALRDLPLNSLIPTAELEELMLFVDQVRKCGNIERRLFHSETDPGKGMKFERVIAAIKTAFEQQEGDFPGVGGFHFHMLRHSAANLWLLKLWPGLGQVARHVFRRHHKTLDWISHSEVFRHSLFGNSQTRAVDLQAIALLMGHGSAATTVEHYLHVLDWYRNDSVLPRSAKCATSG